MKIIKLIAILIVLIILALIVKPFLPEKPAPQNNEETPATTTPNVKESMLSYSNPIQGISFEYPSSLYVKENAFSATSSPALSIVLVKNTQENRDVLNGSTTIAREGPTSITVEVYSNPTNLSANDFAIQKTNWNIATSATSSRIIGGEAGVSYTWSGLYEGRSVVATSGSKAYVFSVTWMTPEDQLIKDFEMILNTASLVRAE